MKTKKYIISFIANINNVEIDELIDYTLSENNYYNVLHKDKKRDYGHYLYSNNIDQEKKAAVIHYSLISYLHNYKIQCIIINKNNIKILANINDLYYERYVLSTY